MTPLDARPRDFISYARSDGEGYARSLRDRLEAEQVPLWRDREGMEGGRDWWQQITAAIDSVEFLVRVITASVSGEGALKVWRVADGRCLMSIQVDGALSACAFTGDGSTLAAVGSRGVYFFACGSGAD